MIQLLKDYWKDEDAVSVVEIIMILAVLIGLVIIFKDQLTALVNSIFSEITEKADGLY